MTRARSFWTAAQLAANSPDPWTGRYRTGGRPPRRHAKWTADEDAYLLAQRERYAEWSSIARKLGRSVAAVKGRAFALRNILWLHRRRAGGAARGVEYQNERSVEKP